MIFVENRTTWQINLIQTSQEYYKFSAKDYTEPPLAQAENSVKDEHAGRLAMMQIFAEMNDSLGFVSCLKERNQSDVPENLLPFALRALTFTEQSEIASTWAESFLDQQTTDDRKIKIISMFEEMGNLERAKEIFNQLSPQALNTPRVHPASPPRIGRQGLPRRHRSSRSRESEVTQRPWPHYFPDDSSRNRFFAEPCVR